MNKEFLQSILRHVATLAAGILAHDLVTKFDFSKSDAQSAASAFLVLGALGWSYWQKRNSGPAVKGVGAASVILFCALLASGCATTNSKNYAEFITSHAGWTVTDITQTTTTPVYQHSESASGISTDPISGTTTITNGKASASIPELGLQWSLNISGLKVQATPEQLAAAQKIAAGSTGSRPVSAVELLRDAQANAPRIPLAK